VHLPLKQHYAAFLKFKGRILITIHDLTHLSFPEFHTRKNIDNAGKGMQFAVDREADLIAISQSTMGDILDSTTVAGDRVHLIYEAADRSRFNVKVNTNDCRRVREKYKLYFDDPYLICLSTLEPRKNLKNTVEAYVLLRQVHPDIPLKLVIAGKKGWNVGSIYQAAREYGDHIFFTGFVDDEDLPYLYSGALAMSYLSFYEGFGLPPLEAMCCGTPVIYGNNSSLVEVVAEGGLAADPRDVNDIKEQYEKIFYDSGLRDRKGRAALKQSLKFSWRDTAIRTLELYEKIIRENV
jgi:glycosyltransferase involved in cell wall biosynthesis